jgi:HK97 family phage major capsid protein
MRASDHAIQLQAATRYELGLQHGAPEAAHASLIAGESDAQFRTRLMRAIALKNFGGSFSMARAIRGMVENHHDGIEREMLQEAARQAGAEPYDAAHPRRIVLPWSYFVRDLQVATGAGGGYLAATSVNEALDILRPWSVAARAGVTVIERLRDSVTQPVTASKATITWLTDEAAPGSESTPALGQIAFTPKLAVGLVELSRRYLLQGVNAEAFVRRELLRTAATAIDQAIFAGSGNNGQPLGLANTPGIQTQAGAGRSYANVLSMKGAIAGANAPDDQIAFIGTPAVRELLEAREVIADTGRFVWDDDRVASRPAFVTTDMPAATLACGSWPDAILGLWGPGIVVELNPFAPTQFPRGIVQVRVIISCDVGFAHPASFCAASPVT